MSPQISWLMMTKACVSLVLRPSLCTYLLQVSWAFAPCHLYSATQGHANQRKREDFVQKRHIVSLFTFLCPKQSSGYSWVHRVGSRKVYYKSHSQTWHQCAGRYNLPTGVEIFWILIQFAIQFLPSSPLLYYEVAIQNSLIQVTPGLW